MSPGRPGDDPDRTTWVRTQVGIRANGLAGLAGLGLRHNPRRAHLLVSTVLGKHVPCLMEPLWQHADRLAQATATAHREATRFAVMGYAETAVGLGSMVAVRLARHTGREVVSFQSTRHTVVGHERLLDFTEPHSHAAAHRVYLARPELLDPGTVVVLCDDELTTGTTAANTVTGIRSRLPHLDRFVVATLIDARPSLADGPLTGSAPQVRVIAQTRATVEVPDGAVARVAQLFADRSADRTPAPPPPGEAPAVVRLGGFWLDFDPLLGIPPGRWPALRQLVGAVTARLRSVPDNRVPETGPDLHVLGVEEDSYLASCVATELGATFSATTRSPVHVVDDDGYPVRSAAAWQVAGEPRFAYGLADRVRASPGPVDLVLMTSRRYLTAEHAPMLDAVAPGWRTVYLVEVDHA
ncbi:MAG: phosphoribosyltransferase family protein [Micrococcales bacterium]|nr:phosphoribosyltransferase family protein [Micrococcales bacterium]